ncbi:UDP-2,4-diacetamido-2,4,6-trideoxy-beta-L-altropyranose hydrolase [Cohnella faecalis]|uniref:UDP-2,4-diacetamido-2,4, 6-trideoxy-beta-L-altropyranose hydrolase n=1 Tax=Cohnella faecalis TaxID=2315694 RepID=A0A398CSY6_9BACL|nr:UDP-2,4-diacetamido-2,4,6-trideoxy-beta-L-altropyranose hydrolase [Cohnella faecalis]RIE02074.1 UDP-2,4-diacetamido-2,4,6-trideoxy-beta-L-altropyranose hydrolase [Cohnella faecalis]
MQVVIRTDASVRIGIGHVMRCLTLAASLRKNGAFVQFVCREHPGHLCDYIQHQGFAVQRLDAVQRSEIDESSQQGYESWLGDSWSRDADQTSDIMSRNRSSVDWLIVDHYAIDSRWEERTRKLANRTMVIDDLANRVHSCDVLLDQNLYANMEGRYRSLIPESCLQLLGPRYALLREEFQNARKNARTRSGSVRRILVFFGGSDPTNETEKALKAIKRLQQSDILVDVVVGGSNNRRQHIEALCSQMANVHFHCQIDYMSELMAKADLAIGAGGSATWERCYLGLPALVVTTAANQVEVTEAVSRAGALIYLGHFEQVSAQTIFDALLVLLSRLEEVSGMSRKALELMPAAESGGAEYVAGLLMK